MTEQTDGKSSLSEMSPSFSGSDSIPELSNESNNTNASIVVKTFPNCNFLVRSKEIKA